jgi:hypothetical protein
MREVVVTLRGWAKLGSDLANTTVSYCIAYCTPGESDDFDLLLSVESSSLYCSAPRYATWVEHHAHTGCGDEG